MNQIRTEAAKFYNQILEKMDAIIDDPEYDGTQQRCSASVIIFSTLALGDSFSLKYDEPAGRFVEEQA